VARGHARGEVVAVEVLHRHERRPRRPVGVGRDDERHVLALDLRAHARVLLEAPAERPVEHQAGIEELYHPRGAGGELLGEIDRGGVALGDRAYHLEVVADDRTGRETGRGHGREGYHTQERAIVAPMTARARKQTGGGASGKASKAKPRRVETPSGASAEARGELLVLRDRKGAVVVVFDAEKGTAEIVAPRGDLSLAAPAGKIVLRAPEVVCQSGKLEVNAERIVERSKETYRETEGLLQTRAGRARQIVEEGYQVLAKRVQIAAEEDAALDGKRVLLG
jgi:hypothetical protein